MRNWHYLHTSRATGWPAQSVALSVVCSAGRVAPARQHTRTVQLLGWAAVAWTGEHGAATEMTSADGVNCDSYWRWLLTRIRKGRTIWVWQLGAVHGLAALGFWDALTRGDWRICGCDSKRESTDDTGGGGGRNGVCVLQDPPTILLARPANSRGACTFVDLRNLSPGASWDGLASDSGVPDIREAGADCVQCGRVVAGYRSRALASWIQTWYETVKALNLGGLRATAAAQAWHGWRASYINVPVEVHCDTERLRAERAAIYGGRNEVYRLYHPLHRVHEIDANAHYPAIASAHTLPGRIARGATGDGSSVERAAQSGLLVIARGRVGTDIPCLPYKRGGCTVYPTGYWPATYCWPEWQLAHRCGARVQIERWWGYEPVQCFAGYMSALWQARSSAREVPSGYRQAALKLLMNSLIGKCCASGRYWRDCPEEYYPEPWAAWPDYDVETNSIARMRSIAGRVQREVKEEWADEAVPALAAWIYSLGRVRLFEWMSIAGWDEIFYVDTDSLWTTERGYDRLCAAGQMANGELGRLRLRAIHPWARFLGHKHYDTPMGLVCAGVPRNGTLHSGDRRTVWRAQRISEACARQKAPDAQIVRHDIADRAPYRGGRAGEDGVVYPWEIYENG